MTKFSNTWASAASTKPGSSRWVSAQETCAKSGALGSGSRPPVKSMRSRVDVLAQLSGRQAMRGQSLLKRYAYAAATFIALTGLGTTTKSQDLPSYMAPISGRTVSSPADTAVKNVLALNTGMFELYDDAAKIFQGNILAKHPVILGLFSGAGGRFILYRPGIAPLEAPSVPIVYQLLKSVDHSTMALAQVVGPYLDNPTDQSWRGPMLAYRARMQSALHCLDETPLPAEWRANNRRLLLQNIAVLEAFVVVRDMSSSP